MRLLGNSSARSIPPTFSFGNELEEMIGTLVPNIENLDAFLKAKNVPKGVWLARMNQIKRSHVLALPDGIQAPDFMVFKRRNRETSCLHH